MIKTITLGIRVDAVDCLDRVSAMVEAALKDSRTWLCTFVNPASVAVARRYPAYAALLRGFDLVLPDGIGMVKSVAWLHRCAVARVSFDSTSLAPVVFRLAAMHRLVVALCGGRPGVAATAGLRISETFGVEIVSFHGYDAEHALAGIIHKKPRMVIVGMGALRQEQFLLELERRGWQGLGFTCGGYLDQLADGMTYYPAWVNRWNLRSAYRLYREPNRLWRRYLLDYPRFALWLSRDLAMRGKLG